MTTVDFRCEQCGKLLSVDAQSGQMVKCPHCEKKVTVPEGLASLPRPQVPSVVAAGAAADSAQSAPPPQEEEEEVLFEESSSNATVSRLMPWVLSVFLHVGMGLIMGFVGMLAVPQKEIIKAEVIIAGDTFSETPGGVIEPGDAGTRSEARQSVKKTTVTGYSKNQSTIVGSTGDSGKTASLIGVAGGGGQAGGGFAKFGVGSGGSGHGPKAAFIGNGGNAHHVVFVIDASGSMSAPGRSGNIFDIVKHKMVQSISKLAEVQDFHIIFFAESTPTEMPEKRLVPAAPEYKARAVRFLDDVVARGGGGTDPIPAVLRAFEVLQRADNTRKGKMIFLLTDGAFRDNDAVLRAIRDRNKTKEVLINTYLYGSTDDESIVKLMKNIAAENGGNFKIIQDE